MPNGTRLTISFPDMKVDGVESCPLANARQRHYDVHTHSERSSAERSSSFTNESKLPAIECPLNALRSRTRKALPFQKVPSLQFC